MDILKDWVSLVLQWFIFFPNVRILLRWFNFILFEEGDLFLGLIKCIFIPSIPFQIQSEAWKIQSYVLGVNFIFEPYESFVRD